MIKQEEVYRIGRLGKAHGVKGEVSFQFDDDIFDQIDADYLVLDIEGILVPFFMEEYRFRNDSVCLVKFCDIDTQEQARELTNCEVYFPRNLSDSGDDDISLSELNGFKLIDHIYNKVVGTIYGIDDSTQNILFEVKTESGDELLIPASPELIRSIDAEEHTINMELPEGLLDI